MNLEAVYSNPTEAAKGIRAELKTAFPGVKFSVRTKYFSMGNSIDVSWAFGPTTKAVDAIIGKYAYGRFDGMTDSSSHEDTLVSMADGTVKVLGGAKYVHSSRRYHVADGDYKAESAFLERVQRDLCALQGIEFAGQNTPFFATSNGYRDSVGKIANRIIWKSDLTKGYNGLRRVSRDGGQYTEDGFAVIPEGEVAAPVPAVEEIPEAVLETHVAAAMEIINHIGPAIRRMRAEARREAVAHRCYIRYPSLDRNLVLRAVLTVLVTELTGG